MQKISKYKERLNLVIRQIINEFENKHDLEFEFAVNDNLLDVLNFGDYWFCLGDVIYDLENNLPKDTILDWHNANIEFNGGITATNIAYINLPSWNKGLRHENYSK